VPKRKQAIVLLLVAISFLSACKKSSDSESPNFFGSPPKITSISITKETRKFNCSSEIELCSVVCLPNQSKIYAQDMDLVKMSAEVTDADGDTNLLVILARFFDPPSTSGTTNEISLEMFNVGPATLGTVTTSNTYPIISGDLDASDHVYTRFFYMKSVIVSDAKDTGDCVFRTDLQQFGGTYSQFALSTPFPASKILNFTYHVEAVDRAGNITSSPATTLGIIETTAAEQTTFSGPCGPPNSSGGCDPPP
jgi:hypothetical protein